MCGHDQRILVNGTVGGGAGGQAGGEDLLAVCVVQHILQIDHVTGGAPVGNQTLGAFQNQVGSLPGGEGGVDLVIAVGVSQVLDLDLDTGLSGEGVGQLGDFGLIAPVAYGVGPQLDGHVGLGGIGGLGLGGLGGVVGGFGVAGLGVVGGLGSTGCQAQDHHHNQDDGKQFLHGIPPHIVCFAWEADIRGASPGNGLRSRRSSFFVISTNGVSFMCLYLSEIFPVCQWDSENNFLNLGLLETFYSSHKISGFWTGPKPVIFGHFAQGAECRIFKKSQIFTANTPVRPGKPCKNRRRRPRRRKF